MLYDFEMVEYDHEHKRSSNIITNDDFYLVTTGDVYSSFNFLSPLALIPSHHPLKQITTHNGITNDIREHILKHGIPSNLNQLRPLLWNALLNVYPSINTSTWQDTIHRNKDSYLLLKSKYLPYPTNDDKQLLHQIEVDLPRTKADLPFFLSKPKTNTKETHYDVLKRLLYIYAKEHEELSYVQGMNEIMATFYYVFYNNVNTKFIALVESDTYFAFSALMDEVSPIFNFDNVTQSQIVVYKKIKLLKTCLKVVYNDVYEVLTEKGVLIDVYVFRWVVLLFTQDLTMSDCVMLWDRLFTRECDKLDFMCYMCCALLGMNKEWLIENETEMEYDLVKEISRSKRRFKINDVVNKALEVEEQMKRYECEENNNNNKERVEDV